LNAKFIVESIFLQQTNLARSEEDCISIVVCLGPGCLNIAGRISNRCFGTKRVSTEFFLGRWMRVSTSGGTSVAMQNAVIGISEWVRIQFDRAFQSGDK